MKKIEQIQKDILIQMKKLPAQFYAGFSLVVISWVLNWSLSGIRTQWAFFPLWLGYSIAVDALVFYRKGTSIIKRSLPGFISLFFFSIPAWWLFELLNQFTHNWYYAGRQYFTDFQYSLFASINFSIVMPAVFGTVELASTFNWIRRIKNGWTVEPSDKNLQMFILFGIVTLLLLIVIPDVFYVFIWLSVFFIIEPINYKTSKY